MHILVVDDEHDVQLLFEQRFRRELRTDEIALHFAFSGEAALDSLKRQEAAQVMLILSDINMPGMSGLELLKRIKSYYTHLKVFLLTAYDDAGKYDMAMQYGADAYLTKPIDFAALKQKIQAL
jgi:CheY-like chemotaxis protein